MEISGIILMILALFFVVGALDRLMGNRLGLGGEFENGFKTLGTLALSMIGIISLAPLIGAALKPAVGPLCARIGIDPAMIPGLLFPCDMGGYTLSVELAASREAGLYAGVIISSTIGNTTLFIIPVALEMLEEKDHPLFACGTMCGIAAVPLGCLCGGFAAGFPARMLVANTVPLLLFSALLICGLLFFRKQCVRAFLFIGKLISWVISLGLALSAIRLLTGWEPVSGLAPLSASLTTIGSIALALAGAYPFCAFLRRLLKRPFASLGARMNVAESAVGGLIYSLANCIPMFDSIKDMDDKGKLINISFAIGAAFVFGDDLAFVSSVSREMILPMIVAKLTAGLAALAATYLLSGTLMRYLGAGAQCGAGSTVPPAKSA